MYLITNREINTKKKGLDIFGKKPNTKGAQEITLVEVQKRGKSWVSKPVTDNLSLQEIKELKKNTKLILILMMNGMGVSELPVKYSKWQWKKRKAFFSLCMVTIMT